MNTTIQNKSASTSSDKKGKKSSVNKMSEKVLLERINELEQKVKSDAVLLTALNEELNNLVYSISHDLRAPLRAVLGYNEILNEDFGSELGEEGIKVIDSIRNNAKKMGALIDGLLSYSRNGRKEIRKTDVNMKELIKGVMMGINRTVKHHADINVAPLHPINADANLMHIVMENLLLNAIKFSSKKENPFIEVLSEEKDNEIIFSVKDNGAGFNMDYSNKMFNIFQRLHTDEEFSGSGVGLAVVQRIINRHGGRVWAEGETNKGARIFIALKA